MLTAMTVEIWTKIFHPVLEGFTVCSECVMASKKLNLELGVTGVFENLVCLSSNGNRKHRVFNNK